MDASSKPFGSHYPGNLPDSSRYCYLPQHKRRKALSALQYQQTLDWLTDELVELAPLGDVQANECRQIATQHLARHWRAGRCYGVAEACETAHDIRAGAVAELDPIYTKDAEAVDARREQYRTAICGGDVSRKQATRRLANIIFQTKKQRRAHATELQKRRWKRTAKKQAVETVADLLLQPKKYATGITIRKRRKQLGKWTEWMEKEMKECIETGKRMSLAEITQHPEGRFYEVYALTKGLEEVADAQGLAGYFATCTLPPEYHPNPGNGNNSWAGWTPEEGKREWMRRWKMALALMDRYGVKRMGLRCMEPHKDGCPHGHLLLYTKKEKQAAVEKALRQAFGESEAAVDFRKIDKRKGSGASYISKYIRKSLAMDETGEAVDAWRSTWGVRAVQFFGTPRKMKTCWQKFRRVSEKQKPRPEEAPFHIWKAARGGEAATFIRLLANHGKDYELITEKRELPMVPEGFPEPEPPEPKVVGIRHKPSGWTALTCGHWRSVVEVIPKYPSEEEGEARKKKKPPQKQGPPPPQAPPRHPGTPECKVSGLTGWEALAVKCLLYLNLSKSSACA